MLLQFLHCNSIHFTRTDSGKHILIREELTSRKPGKLVNWVFSPFLLIFFSEVFTQLNSQTAKVCFYLILFTFPSQVHRLPLMCSMEGCPMVRGLCALPRLLNEMFLVKEEFF